MLDLPFFAFSEICQNVISGSCLQAGSEPNRTKSKHFESLDLSSNARFPVFRILSMLPNRRFGFSFAGTSVFMKYSDDLSKSYKLTRKRTCFENFCLEFCSLRYWGHETKF